MQKVEKANRKDKICSKRRISIGWQRYKCASVLIFFNKRYFPVHLMSIWMTTQNKTSHSRYFYCTIWQQLGRVSGWSYLWRWYLQNRRWYLYRLWFLRWCLSCGSNFSGIISPDKSGINKKPALRNRLFCLMLTNYKVCKNAANRSRSSPESKLVLFFLR